MTAGGDDRKDSFTPAPKLTKAEVRENIAGARSRHQARQVEAEAARATFEAARANFEANVEAEARAEADVQAWEAIGKPSEEGGWFLLLSQCILMGLGIPFSLFSGLLSPQDC